MPASRVPYRNLPGLASVAQQQLDRNFDALGTIIDGKSGVPILVAAANAPSAEFSAAAFKCSGTDDATIINQALAVVQAAPGGVLQLSAGTFNLGATQITSLTGCTLRGRGIGVTTLKLTTGTNGSNNLLTTNTATGAGGTEPLPVLVEELTIDGNGVNNPSFGGCAIAYANGSGAAIFRNIRITGVTTSAFAVMGANPATQSVVGPYYLDNVEMDNCTALRGYSGGSGAGAGPFMRACHLVGAFSNSTVQLAGSSAAETFIVGSWIANTHASGAVVKAASTLQQNSSIVGNFIAGQGGIAFLAGTSMTGVTITDNTFVTASAATACVSLGEGDYIFTDNYVSTAVVGVAVVCAGTTSKRITGNTVTNTQQDGIKVTATAASKGLVIQDNTVVNPGRQTANTFPGISLTAGAFTITDTAIVGNIVRVTSGSAIYGINIADAGCTNTLVWGNDVNGAYGTANVHDAGTGTRTVPDPAPPGGAPSGAAGGDLGGTYPNPTVAGLQGRAVASIAPNSGDLLEWNGTQWAPFPKTILDMLTVGTFNFTVVGSKQNMGSVTETVPTGRTYKVLAILSAWTLPASGANTFRTDVLISFDGGSTFTSSLEMVSQTNVPTTSFTDIGMSTVATNVATGTIVIVPRGQQDAGTLGRLSGVTVSYIIVPV